MNKTKKRNQIRQDAFKERIRNTVSSLQVGVMGYENSISENIITYFKKLESETTIEIEQIYVRIFWNAQKPRACLYHQGRHVKEISSKELVELFTNKKSYFLLDLERVTNIKLNNFIEIFSKDYAVYPNNVHISVHIKKGLIIVDGNEGVKKITEIPLTDLIKHFIR